MATEEQQQPSDNITFSRAYPGFAIGAKIFFIICWIAIVASCVIAFGLYSSCEVQMGSSVHALYGELAFWMWAAVIIASVFFLVIKFAYTTVAKKHSSSDVDKSWHYTIIPWLQIFTVLFIWYVWTFAIIEC